MFLCTYLIKQSLKPKGMNNCTIVMENKKEK